MILRNIWLALGYVHVRFRWMPLERIIPLTNIQTWYFQDIVLEMTWVVFEPPHGKTNKITVRTAKTKISLGIRPIWSESSLSTSRKLRSLATHWAHSEDSDQTGRMPRLIWVFAGRTVILLVLYWDGSYFIPVLSVCVCVCVFLSHLMSWQDMELDCIDSWKLLSRLMFHLIRHVSFEISLCCCL